MTDKVNNIKQKETEMVIEDISIPTMDDNMNNNIKQNTQNINKQTQTLSKDMKNKNN